MARFYSNENFPLATVKYLRELGHDVLTTLDAGRSNQRIPDEEVLLFAIQEKRAVITTNRKDFIRLHKNNPQHHGIIVCTEFRDFEALALKIHTSCLSAEFLENELIRVYRD